MTQVVAPCDRRSLLRAAAVLPLAAVSGCAFFDTIFQDNKKKMAGKREDVLPVNEGLQPEHGIHATVTLPAPTTTDWPVEGGKTSHIAGNATLPANLHEVWRARMGVGNAYRRQITATPLAVGDTVFTMDSDATVSAFHASDGHMLWRRVTKPKASRTTNIGGGMGYADDTLYVTTGYSQVMALDPKTGAVRWLHMLNVPIRSAPTPGEGLLFMVTVDEVLVALSAHDGRQLWTYEASAADTSLLGHPAPAFVNGLVLAGFGSGDLVAVRGSSGAVAWSDSIAAAAGQAGVAQIAAISGQPIIIDDVAVAIGTGGLMVGEDLRGGRRLWEHEVSGILSPIAAGDFVFVTTTDQQPAAIVARTGEVAWLTQLPQYIRPKTKGGPLTWTGVVMANGMLIYTGMNNQIAMLDAITGKLLRTMKVKGSITVAPIVARNTLYLVDDHGFLRAFR